MTLNELAQRIDAQATGEGLEVEVRATGSAVTHDSRRAVQGGIFVAVTGTLTDGNRFVGEATKRGAIAIISAQPRPADFAGAWLQVADARIALARAAALIHGDPARRLKLVGITGTNGKTTTAHLVESIIRAAGQVPAMMGTISYRIGDETTTAEFTTPEASEIQHFLRRAVAAGARYAVMEVSSHAIDLRRIEGMQFAVAAFTNLTQDHLDYHKTMDEYFNVKRRLFDGGIGTKPERAVINLDDPRGETLRQACGGGAISYSLNRGALERGADITISGEREFGLDGLKFTAITQVGEIAIESTLVGRPHAYNILCAIGIGQALGFDNATIARGIAECRSVAGRFERASTAADDITVVVDYAHTPDALINVLRTVRDALGRSHARIVTVMGCGGDRDKTKRPLMGEAAAQLSDQVIATSDNPRSEDPHAILTDIEVGLARGGGAYELIEDRRTAIRRAIDLAAPGDVVLIAGKGHEDYQILSTGKIHFDDREEARAALDQRRVRNAD